VNQTGRPITYGIHGGTEGASMADSLAYWRKVESLGYEWISCWDHFLPIYGYNEQGSFEAVATHAALAMATTRVKVGILVYSVGYRHPAIVANAIATIDHLSNGRAQASLGAGWAKQEYDGYGLPFPAVGERIDQMIEGIEVVAGLLRNDTFNFQGKHFQLNDGRLGVRPVQERVPVWVGGQGEKRTIPQAARIADGWDAPLGPSAADFGRKVAILEQECERIGRDPASVSRSAHISVVRDEAEMRSRFANYSYADTSGAVVYGSDQQVLDGIKAFIEAGADQILLANSVMDGTEQLERVAELLGLR
jgi:alkanesulfonate monooxygenase SsuD/methylene tetrahydromethanopterin reductase-like flavin-dependent oxidoreductase (luciferase family)